MLAAINRWTALIVCEMNGNVTETFRAIGTCLLCIVLTGDPLCQTLECEQQVLDSLGRDRVKLYHDFRSNSSEILCFIAL